jgi:excisionase family DNA binding protein
MPYSLSQAATAAGVRKSTVFRWVKAGKVSATRADDGNYRIDPAELQRYLDYSVATEQDRHATPARSATLSETRDSGSATDTEMQRAADALRAEVAKLQALLEAERQRGEEWKAQANRWAEQAERLALTHAVPAAAPAVQQSRGVFGWLRRA